jgi:argininosuccinate lyase
MINKVGEAGGRLHAGRSRNDLCATLNRMSIRKTVWTVLEAVVSLQESLVEKAEINKESVMTGYTHFQPGQPITMGHYYMAIYSALCRDFNRIKAAYQNLNTSPYGVAAFAGSSFPIDRQMLCDLLGFDSVMENSLDCVASKDFIMELMSGYSILASNLSRVAEDMYFWATHENGILDIGGEIAICSSIMPQKKNPVSLEYARAKTSHVIGSLMSCITTQKGNPFSNTMDIFETSTMYWTGIEQLKKVILCILETVKHSSLRKELAKEKAANNLCTVTSLADYMVKNHGISFTDAHHIVGEIVAIITENGKYIPGITSEVIAEQSKITLGYEIKMTPDEIDSVLDPFLNVESKQGIGGPSVKSVTKMIENAKGMLAEERQWLDGAKAKVRAAYGTLEKEEASLCGK